MASFVSSSLRSWFMQFSPTEQWHTSAIMWSLCSFTHSWVEDVGVRLVIHSFTLCCRCALCLTSVCALPWQMIIHWWAVMFIITVCHRHRCIRPRSDSPVLAGGSTACLSGNCMLAGVLYPSVTSYFRRTVTVIWAVVPCIVRSTVDMMLTWHDIV